MLGARDALGTPRVMDALGTLGTGDTQGWGSLGPLRVRDALGTLGTGVAWDRGCSGPGMLAAGRCSQHSIFHGFQEKNGCVAVTAPPGGAGAGGGRAWGTVPAVVLGRAPAHGRAGAGPAVGPLGRSPALSALVQRGWAGRARWGFPFPWESRGGGGMCEPWGETVALGVTRLQDFPCKQPVLGCALPPCPCPQAWKGKRDGTAPHVCSVAQRALRNLLTQRQDQAIVPLGRSGAGKSSCCRSVLEYLVGTAGSVDGRVSGTGHGGQSGQQGLRCGSWWDGRVSGVGCDGQRGRQGLRYGAWWAAWTAGSRVWVVMGSVDGRVSGVGHGGMAGSQVWVMVGWQGLRCRAQRAAWAARSWVRGMVGSVDGRVSGTRRGGQHGRQGLGYRARWALPAPSPGSDASSTGPGAAGCLVLGRVSARRVSMWSRERVPR